MMNIKFLVKNGWEFYHFKCYVIWEAYQATFSFINFELLEFYRTYFSALQTTTPKVPPDETHEFRSWPENEMMCHEFELWDLMR